MLTTEAADGSKRLQFGEVPFSDCNIRQDSMPTTLDLLIQPYGEIRLFLSSYTTALNSLVAGLFFGSILWSH